jgi:hypothetical protein
MTLCLATTGCAGLIAIASLVATCAEANDKSSGGTDAGFEVSYTAGRRDAAGRFMGGTELRNLAIHHGKLYAGSGYWMDRPGPEGPQPAQILSLDEPSGRWRVERSFDEMLPTGRSHRHLAVSALLGVTLATDAAGRPLPRPVSMLLAGTWALSGLSEVFSRNDGTGGWTAMPLPVRRVTTGIQQVRAIGAHRDRQTGVDQVFAGNDRFGVYSGTYDAAASGQIRWSTTPELDMAGIVAPSFPGLSLPRVTSFAECNGVLYAAVGQQIYRRLDGVSSRWELLYTNPRPGRSETGLRGLTAIPAPSGTGQSLLVAVEGTAARIIRIDPSNGQETTELDIRAFLDEAWRTKVGYVIAAYNDMTVLRGGEGNTEVLIGIEAFLPAASPTPAGHVRADGLDGGGWYLVRHGDGRYDLRKIGSRHPATGSPLVATRTIAASPFAQEPDAVYFGGFDANKQPAHNTAWVFRAAKMRVLAP